MNNPSNDRPEPLNESTASEPESRNTNPSQKNSASTTSLFQIVGFLFLILLSVLIFRSLIDPGSSSNKRSTDSSFGEKHNRQRIAHGMEPRDDLSEVESVSNISARLTSDAETLASLVASMHELLDKKDTQLQEARAEAIAAMKEQRRIRQQLKDTRQQLEDNTRQVNQISRLEAELEAARSHNQALTREIESLQSNANNSQTELMTLRSERDEFATRVGELESQIARLKQSLTAARNKASQPPPPAPQTKPDDIPDTEPDSIETQAPATPSESDSTADNQTPERQSTTLTPAANLIASLKKLNDSTSEELARAYSQFGIKHNANILQTCRFEPDSAKIDESLSEPLRNLPSEAPDGTLLLIVGYHSPEKDPTNSNAKLTQKRLAAVAETLRPSIRSKQSVQTINLGPTDRFSKRRTSTNNRVEIWQITKR